MNILSENNKQEQETSHRLTPLARRVAARAFHLQSAYLADQAQATASLAVLRRAINSQPGDDPAAWAETFTVIGNESGWRQQSPTVKEWAAHTALTLFAHHQQSQRDRGMHQAGNSLGSAVSQLAKRQGGEDGDESQPILRRFQALGTATSFAETIHHAHSIIGQLRAEGIPLDYGQLTDDLIYLQNPESARRVRLNWGRDFYRISPSESSINTTQDQGVPE